MNPGKPNRYEQRAAVHWGALLIVAGFLLYGCATYEPLPLDPDYEWQVLESIRIEDLVAKEEEVETVVEILAFERVELGRLEGDAEVELSSTVGERALGEGRSETVAGAVERTERRIERVRETARRRAERQARQLSDDGLIHQCRVQKQNLRSCGTSADLKMGGVVRSDAHGV